MKNPKKSKKLSLKILDRMGLSLSFLCLIHCMFVPVLLFLLPSYRVLLGSLHADLHYYLYIFILPISLSAFLPRIYLDKQWEFLWGPLSAIILLGMTLYLHENHLLPYEKYLEPALTTIASLTLIYFHYRNFKLRNHKCPKC